MSEVETKKDEVDENHIYEGPMIAMKRYKDVMYDETSILHMEVALSLLDTDPARGKMFINQSQDFLNKRLQHTTSPEERKSMEKLKLILGKIHQQEYNNADVQEASKEIETLQHLMSKKVRKAKDGYYRIFKPH